jgi:lysyl-tRNA synthetase class 2
MAQGDEIRDNRIKKLELLRARGIDPYPVGATFSLTRIIDVLKKFKTVSKGKKQVGIAGRIMARRQHGGSMFLDIKDGSGKLQAFLGKDKLPEGMFDRIAEVLDVGDICAVEGKAFYTKREEPTIEVASWEMLSKSLRPLPEKWHGISDVEERFRRRYLDLIMNNDVRDRFITRSRVIQSIRAFFDKEGFFEVETPMLHAIPGGALAKPFVTHHNALDTDLYLRIAPELYLKRLLVGGLDRVYEIGKSFRNEGIDPRHNPEFTTIEWYASYWDEEDMMECVERYFASLPKILGKKTISYGDTEISFTTPFPRVTFQDLLRKYAGIMDYEKEPRDNLVLRARQLGIDPEPHESKGKIADEIYKKVCRPKMIQPIFLTNHPLDISPLAKKFTDRPNEVRRFQLVVAGLEVVNAFSELNDPIDQKERFMGQEEMRVAGEVESHPLDEDFVEALEYGMPPAAGAAIGIDRLIMLLTNTESIKEVILFPTLRPKEK